MVFCCSSPNWWRQHLWAEIRSCVKSYLQRVWGNVKFAFQPLWFKTKLGTGSNGCWESQGGVCHRGVLDFNIPMSLLQSLKNAVRNALLAKQCPYLGNIQGSDLLLKNVGSLQQPSQTSGSLPPFFMTLLKSFFHSWETLPFFTTNMCANPKF